MGKATGETDGILFGENVACGHAAGSRAYAYGRNTCAGRHAFGGCLFNLQGRLAYRYPGACDSGYGNP